MIKYNKNKEPTYFNKYNLKMEEISLLIQEINIIINNFRKKYEDENKEFKNINTYDIFNTWLFYYPKWNKMPFEFLVDVYDYMEIVKDEDGIILA